MRMISAVIRKYGWLITRPGQIMQESIMHGSIPVQGRLMESVEMLTVISFM